MLVQRILPTPVGDRCVIRHQVFFAATLLRCFPTVDDQGQPPSALTLDAAGRALALDGQAMWQAITGAVREGTWPEGVLCRSVHPQGLEPLAPSGGLAGWQVGVSVTL